MKKKSLTAIRNSQIVGNNSKSYNDKHPENPVSLRPIHDACKDTRKDEVKLRRTVRKLANLSKPEIDVAISQFNVGR